MLLQLLAKFEFPTMRVHVFPCGLGTLKAPVHNRINRENQLIYSGN